MSLFKQKITLDQFIYLVITEIINFVDQTMNVFEDNKIQEAVDIKIKYASIWYATMFLGGNSGDEKEMEANGYNMGKRLGEALIYYYQKMGFNKDKIIAKMEVFNTFMDLLMENFCNYSEDKINTPDKILYVIYEIINNSIRKEFDAFDFKGENYMNKDIINNNGKLAEYTTIVLKGCSNLINTLKKSYKIIDL